jgi:hypothetical protein
VWPIPIRLFEAPSLQAGKVFKWLRDV